MIQEAIVRLSNREDLTAEQAGACLDEIMEGQTGEAQTAAFLMGLAVKGETVEEIAACAASMRAHATRLPHEGEVLEIVGTGGDRSHSFNISSTAALVIAAAGVPVAKHGNRSASSLCGAADVYEALGVNIRLQPEQMARVLSQTGIAFLFAQVYHQSMKYVAPVRKALGCHTVFNILGPLTNPAFNTLQVMGVYKPELVEPMAEALSRLGVRRGMVVYGQDVLDEISVSAPTTVCEFEGESRKIYEITPEQFGIARCKKEDLLGGLPEENAAITRAVLGGEAGPKRHAVLLNAAAGLLVAGRVDSWEQGIQLAAETIDSGAACAKLDAFVAASQAV